MGLWLAISGTQRGHSEVCCPASVVALRFRHLSRGMPLAREQRKLAAMLAADVVGDASQRQDARWGVRFQGEGGHDAD